GRPQHVVRAVDRLRGGVPPRRALAGDARTAAARAIAGRGRLALSSRRSRGRGLTRRKDVNRKMIVTEAADGCLVFDSGRLHFRRGIYWPADDVTTSRRSDAGGQSNGPSFHFSMRR